MRVRYDQEADALEILLREGEGVARTEEVDAGTLVDLNQRGAVVAIEVLRPARDWPLNAIFERFSFRVRDAAALRSLFDKEGEPYPYARPAAVAAEAAQAELVA